MYALEKEELDYETKEVSVLTKAIGEKETVALTLEQSAKKAVEACEAADAAQQKVEDAAIEQSAAAVQEKVEAQPRPARPPPWRDKLWRNIPHDWRRCNRGTEFVVAKAGIQEGVKKHHLCLSITQMMQMNWNVMVSSRNRKHMSRSWVRWTLKQSLESLRCPRKPSKVWKQLCVMVAVST